MIPGPFQMLLRRHATRNWIFFQKLRARQPFSSAEPRRIVNLQDDCKEGDSVVLKGYDLNVELTEWTGAQLLSCLKLAGGSARYGK